jgi:hypothetical protein
MVAGMAWVAGENISAFTGRIQFGSHDQSHGQRRNFRKIKLAMSINQSLNLFSRKSGCLMRRLRASTHAEGQCFNPPWRAIFSRGKARSLNASIAQPLVPKQVREEPCFHQFALR